MTSAFTRLTGAALVAAFVQGTSMPASGQEDNATPPKLNDILIPLVRSSALALSCMPEQWEVASRYAGQPITNPVTYLEFALKDSKGYPAQAEGVRQALEIRKREACPGPSIPTS